MKHFFILCFVFVLTFLGCYENSGLDKVSIKEAIDRHEQKVVWALNHANADSLMNQFWHSPKARFIINGRAITGFEEISSRLRASIERRKKIELTIRSKDIWVLSPKSAFSNVTFDQIITDLEGNRSQSSGAWTSVYQKKNGRWKVVLVHESIQSN